MNNQLMTDNQVNAIGRELSRRVSTGEAEGHTVVVTLVSMVKAGRLNQSHIQRILNMIYDDKIKIVAVLIEAQKFLDEDMVDSIIAEVKATN